MYSDIFDIGTFNRRLANKVGLNTAVYWTELMHIAPKAREKGTMDSDSFFPVDRDYIEERTALTRTEQYACDRILSSLSALEYNSDNLDSIKVRSASIAAVIADENVRDLKTLIANIKTIANDKAAVVKATKKVAAVKKEKTQTPEQKAEKQAGILISMTNYAVKNEIDPEMIQSLTEWVDAVMTKFGFITQMAITSFKDTVYDYTKDKKIRRCIIKIATINSYRDAVYAIKKYEGQKGFFNETDITNVSQSAQQVATELSDDILF